MAVSVGERLIIDGADERSLLVRETKDGFLLDAYENGIYASMDLTTGEAALLVKWLRDRIEGVDDAQS
jgi:hypothetical protein